MKNLRTKEVVTTLAATAAFLLMSFSMTGCTQLVPEKQSHIEAKAAVQRYFAEEDVPMCYDGQNEQADLLI